MAQAYFNLQLDTSSPSCLLSLGTNGYINSLTGTLGITCEALDISEMKIWGIVGTLSTDFTGDGTTTDFTVTAQPDALTVVSVGGTATTDYTYEPTTGVVSFNTAPANDASSK